MRNLNRISNYWNVRAAWEDWHKLAATCDKYLVSLFQPPPDAGWRVIDKAHNQLKAATARAVNKERGVE